MGTELKLILHHTLAGIFLTDLAPVDIKLSNCLTEFNDFVIMTFVMKLDKNQRKELGKALFNTGNLILAVIVLGQFVGKELDFAKLISGFILWVIFFIVATILNMGE